MEELKAFLADIWAKFEPFFAELYAWIKGE